MNYNNTICLSVLCDICNAVSFATVDL
jgi:hypothetical protein